MLLLAGSMMASSLGWSLALGCKPAAVLKLLWYLLGLFLYSWSSFFLLRESASLRFALFTMAAMALWQGAGMSFISGGLGSFRTALACVRVCVVLLGSVVIGVSVFGLGSMFLAMFLSFEIRLSCLVSDFVIWGCSFVLVSFGGGRVMGQIVWARR